MAVPASCNPRKSPRQTRSKATVAAILEAAAYILETHGLTAYTSNAIAQRAGVNIGSLYQYFPSKEAITQALIDAGTEAMLIDIQTLAHEHDPPSGLDQIIQIAVYHQLKRPRLARLLDSEEDRLRVARPQGPHRDVVTLIKRYLSVSNWTVQTEPTIIAYDLIAIIRGLVDSAGRRGETDTLALTERVRKAVFGYLTAPVTSSAYSPLAEAAVRAACS